MIKPNFFIVGGPKCGTTALYEYLRLHSQIFMPDAKEPNYFGRRTLTGRQHTEETYLDLFRDAGPARFIGEASPLTLVCETAAQEIHEFSPNAKIIAMVRDPIEMLHSLHAQCLVNSDEDIDDFAAALDAEADRLQGRRIPSHCGDTSRLLYKRCARFSEQLERFINVFGHDRVHIIVFDSFKADTDGVYSEVLAFLGAEPYRLSEYPRINESKRLRSAWLGRRSKRLQKAPAIRFFGNAFLSSSNRQKLWGLFSSIERKMNRVPYRRPHISPALEKELRAEFAPEIKRLGRILDRDLSHWLELGGSPNIPAASVEADTIE